MCSTLAGHCDFTFSSSTNFLQQDVLSPRTSLSSFNMKLSSAAIRSIGLNHPDQRYSASFHPAPNAANLAEEVAVAYSIKKTPFADRRDKLSAIGVDQYIFADHRTQQFRVLTKPIYDSTGTGPVWICSLGDDMKAGAVPVWVSADYFRATFAGLVLDSAAKKFDLFVDPIDPDTIPAPDYSQPSVQRLQFSSEQPALASLPLLCAVPPGFVIPATMPFDNIDPTVVAAFPFFAVWAKGIVHAFVHNNGMSLDLDGPLFAKDPDDNGTIHPVPSADKFAIFSPVADLRLGVSTICAIQHPDKVDKCRTAVCLIFDSAYSRVGEREAAADRIPDHFRDQGSSPGTGGSPGFDPKAFGEVLGQALKTNLPGPATSLADKSHLEEVNDLERYFSILGASKDEQGNLVPGKLKDEFKAVLATTPLTRAQDLFATEMDVHLRSLDLEKGMDFIVKSITLDTQLFKGLLGGAILRGKVFSDTLVKDPTQCKKYITFVAFLPARTRGHAYKEQLDAGTATMIHELTAEHASKRERKLTELLTDVQVADVKHIVAGIANIYAVMTYMIEDYDKSLLWSQWLEVLTALTSRAASGYFDFNRNLKQIYLHLVVDCHELYRHFHEVAINPLYRSQLKKNGTLDKAIFQDALSISKGIARSLKKEIARQQASMEMREVPTIASLFPYLKLVKDESASGGGKHPSANQQQSATKRTRTDGPTNSSASSATNSGGRPSPVLDQAGLDKQKKVGFLQWSKPGGIPPTIKFAYPGANGVSERVCFNGISQGPYCRFGDKCHGQHPKKLTDIPVDKQKEFVKFIESTDGLSFLPGKGPSGN